MSADAPAVAPTDDPRLAALVTAARLGADPHAVLALADMRREMLYWRSRADRAALADDDA